MSNDDQLLAALRRAGENYAVLHRVQVLTRSRICPPRYLGVDVGRKGALACTDETGYLDVLPMPFAQKRRLDHDAIVRWLALQGNVADARIEQQVSMPGQRANGYSPQTQQGELRGLLAGLNISSELVHPSRWKKGMQVLADKQPGESAAVKKRRGKALSIGKAMVLYPKEDFMRTPRSKVPCDGMAEAALIANYTMRFGAHE